MNQKEQYAIAGFVLLALVVLGGGLFLLMYSESRAVSTGPVPPVGHFTPAPGSAPPVHPAGQNTTTGEVHDRLRPQGAMADYEARLAAGGQAPTSSAASSATGSIALATAGPRTGTSTGGSATDAPDAADIDSDYDPNVVPGIPPTDKAAFVAEVVDDQAMLTPEQKVQAADIIKKLEDIFDKYMPQIEKDRRAQLEAYGEAYRLGYNREQTMELELEWLQYRSKIMLPYIQERKLLVQELLPMLDVEQRRYFDGSMQSLNMQQAQYQNALQGKLMR